MTPYQKEYELLHDIRKITLPKEASYDELDLNSNSAIHEAQLEHYPPIVFPGDGFPPQSQLMSRMNSVFGNPWNQPHTWSRDGYIEDSLRPGEGKISDRTIILSILLLLTLIFGLFYMTLRLLRNGWCRYRKGRAIQEAKGVHAWGRWIDGVGLRGKRPVYHWDYGIGNKRVQTYPV